MVIALGGGALAAPSNRPRPGSWGRWSPAPSVSHRGHPPQPAPQPPPRKLRRMAATAAADEAYQIVSTAFDQAFYRFANPELDEPGFDPIRHYLDIGWREGRDPAPWFSV